MYSNVILEISAIDMELHYNSVPHQVCFPVRDCLTVNSAKIFRIGRKANGWGVGRKVVEDCVKRRRIDRNSKGVTFIYRSHLPSS